MLSRNTEHVVSKPLDSLNFYTGWLTHLYNQMITSTWKVKVSMNFVYSRIYRDMPRKEFMFLLQCGSEEVQFRGFDEISRCRVSQRPQLPLRVLDQALPVELDLPQRQLVAVLVHLDLRQPELLYIVQIGFVHLLLGVKKNRGGLYETPFQLGLNWKIKVIIVV